MLDVKVDGAIGPETLKAVENRNFDELKMRLTEEITNTYKDIIKRDPKQIYHQKGWLNRTNRY